MTTTTPYTGASDAVCPITLAYVHELAYPVALAPDAAQPYELGPLWKWLRRSDRHPLTGQTCGLGDITPLRFGEGYCNRARVTEVTLRKLRVGARKEKEFREEIKEMKDELDKLSQSIEQTVLGLDTIIAEKLKLEIKLKNIQAKFTEKKKQNQTSSCTVC